MSIFKTKYVIKKNIFGREEIKPKEDCWTKWAEHFNNREEVYFLPHWPIAEPFLLLPAAVLFLTSSPHHLDCGFPSLHGLANSCCF